MATAAGSCACCSRFVPTEATVKTILALVMIALPMGAYGQLVKCVAKDGKVEYARDCPAGTTEQKTGIKRRPGHVPGGAEGGDNSESADKLALPADDDAPIGDTDQHST